VNTVTTSFNQYGLNDRKMSYRKKDPGAIVLINRSVTQHSFADFCKVTVCSKKRTVCVLRAAFRSG